MNPTVLQSLPLPLRLLPGVDLRRALQEAVAQQGWQAAFVAAGIGSLKPARIRLAGAAKECVIDADCELLTLSGSVSPTACHLHLSVADATGQLTGGHAMPGCIVRTTAEVLLLGLPGWAFGREPDPATGWLELVVRPGP